MEAMDKCNSQPLEMLCNPPPRKVVKHMMVDGSGGDGKLVQSADLLSHGGGGDGSGQNTSIIWREFWMEAMDKCGSQPSEMLELESWTDAMDKCSSQPSKKLHGSSHPSRLHLGRGEFEMQLSPSSGSVGDGGGLHSRSHLQRNSINGRSVLELNVIVRCRTHKGEEEIIAEEKAVCKFCFRKFREEDGLKTKCGCTNAFAHEKCEADWSTMKGHNNCDNCGTDVETSHVYFALKPVSTQGDIGTSHKKKKKMIACFF